MTARRQARTAASIQAATLPRGGVPDDLAAGPCVEVWAADGSNLIDAKVKYSTARHDWLRRNGYDVNDLHAWPPVLRSARSPYSLTRLRTDQPERLAQFLTSRGLPVDWSPTTTRSRARQPRGASRRG